MMINPALLSSGVALAALGGNWYRSRTFEFDHGGTIGYAVDGAALLLIAFLILIVVTSRSAYSVIRICLAHGKEVAMGDRFIRFRDAWPLLFLPPILLRIHWSGRETDPEPFIGFIRLEPDPVAMSYIQGYGSDHSAYLLAAAALLILAVGFRYRLLNQLEGRNLEQNKSP